MTDTLVSGNRIEIRGFGSFEIREYDGYTARNPRTGVQIEAKPKKLPFFKVGKDLRELILECGK
jgi:integration host factor subunit beta